MRLTKHYCDVCGREGQTEQMRLVTERESRSTESRHRWLDFCDHCKAKEQARWQQWIKATEARS